MKFASIVPVEFQNELMQIGETNIFGSWRTGDIANHLAEINILNGEKVEKMKIYDAVGFYSKTPSRTVRYYARVAKFFGPEAREEFSALSFGHFDFACDREDWYDVLSYALSGFEKINQPYSIDAIKKKFLYSTDDWSDDFGQGDDYPEITDSSNGDYSSSEASRANAEETCDRLFEYLYRQALKNCQEDFVEKLEETHVMMYNIIDEAYTN
jgi:hypothetical protein